MPAAPLPPLQRWAGSPAPAQMTTPPDDQAADDFLTEEEAHRVLARAVELDARALSDVSRAQLQSIAAEAGIAPEALARALRELRAGELPGGRAERAPRPLMSERLRRLRHYAAIAAGLIAAAASPGDYMLLTLLGSLPIYALYELLIHRVDRRERGGPSSPSSKRAADDDAAASGRPTAPGRDTRSLSLRPRGLAPAA